MPVWAVGVVAGMVCFGVGFLIGYAWRADEERERRGW